MAQDPTSNNDTNSDQTSPSPPPISQATPSAPNNNNILKLKYAKFVKRVKLSAQKAKDEARRKRLQQRKVRSYKHNHRIITAQQNKRQYTISTRQLNHPSQKNNDEQTTDNDNNNKNAPNTNNSSNIMDDDWECIVIHKKPPPIPQLTKAKTAPNILNNKPSSLQKAAPPPIPHERRAEFEHKRNGSNPVQILFNQIAKKKREKSEKKLLLQKKGSNNDENNGNIHSSLYDEDAFNLDSGMEEKVDMDTNMDGMEDNKEFIISINWQWCDDGGEWHNYGSSTCKEIESFYQNSMDKYEYDIFGRIYCIDFKEMKQFNNLNQAWNVRRNEIKQEKWE